MGEWLERYLPARERVTALWLAWVVAMLVVPGFLPESTFGYWAQRHPVRNAALHALVYVALVALALWRARARAGAPAIVVGGAIVFAAVTVASRLMSVLTLAADRFAGAPFPVPLRQTVVQQALASAGPAAVVVLGLLALFVHALLSQGEDDEVSPDVSGFGAAADPLGRRFVAAGALLMLGYSVLVTLASAALTIATYSRATAPELITTNPRAAIAAAAISPVAAFLATYLVVRRPGIPQAVWLTVFAKLAVGALGGIASMLSHAFPASGRDLLELAAVVGDMLLWPAVITAAMLLAVRLATRERPAPPSAEGTVRAA